MRATSREEQAAGQPTVRDAVTPLIVGAASAMAAVMADYFAESDIWMTAGASGMGAWLAAFVMTGRWR